MEQIQPHPQRNIVNDGESENSQKNVRGASAAYDQDQLIDEKCDDKDVDRAHEGELRQREGKLRQRQRHGSSRDRTSKYYLIAGGVAHSTRAVLFSGQISASGGPPHPNPAVPVCRSPRAAPSLLTPTR